jgi:hypothetical protein
VKSPEPGNKAQRKVEKLLQKLSAEIITGNYHRKNVRFFGVTGVSKDMFPYN